MEWSDYDLAVVSERLEGLDRFERAKILAEAVRDGAIELHGYTAAEFLEVARYRPLLWETLRDGVPLVDDGLFAEARRRLEALRRDGLVRPEGRNWRFDPSRVR